MKKTWKIMLCVLLTIAILGGVWMLSARVTSAQIYAALEELPVTNKTSEISAYLDRYFIDDYDEQALADGKRLIILLPAVLPVLVAHGLIAHAKRAERRGRVFRAKIGKLGAQRVDLLPGALRVL